MNWKNYNNWHLSSKEIAAETGVTQPSASKARRRYAPKTRRAYRVFDWDSVDWDMRTKDISEEVEAPPTYVSKVRNTRAPHTVRKKPPPDEQ